MYLLFQDDDRIQVSMPNVFILYPVFLGLICIVVKKFFNECDKESFEMLLGYLFSLLPFALFRREALIKHYSIPLVFGIFGLVLFVEKNFKPIRKGYVLSLLSFLAIFGHIYWGALIYAKDIIDIDFCIWNSHWLSI